MLGPECCTRSVCRQVASGQISMRDCRVEEVSHITDSDEDSDTPPQTADLTIGLFPSHQSPTYLIMANKGEKVGARHCGGSRCVRCVAVA